MVEELRGIESLFCLKALTKFLKCVNWNNEQECKEAVELMQKWEPINVEDSLELLSPAFQEPAVRQYAVGRLMQADDEVTRCNMSLAVSRFVL